MRDEKGRFIKGHPQPFRELISKKNIGRKHSDNHKLKISKSNSGKIRNVEHRLKYRNSKLGEKNPNYNKEYTIEERQRWSEYTKKIWENMPEETVEKRNTKIREARINHIKKIGGVRIGKYETSILDFLEESFGYRIKRQYEVIGYFLDGYCPVLNLAIEIDETYHNKKEQLKKDNKREELIKKQLGCKFLRLEV